MKRKEFALGALAVLLALLLLGATRTDEGSDVGRYQLFQGHFYHYVSKSSSQLPSSREEQIGVFLLDTVTGETWTYFQSNTSPSRWVAVGPPTSAPEEDGR